MKASSEHHYRTITEGGKGEYREKGSKFFGQAFPVRSSDDIRKCLEEVQSEHPKSRHVCYAWKLGTDGLRFRANDDGEPSGSAGKPILGRIESFEITDTLITVVRYFGGTKLGVPGLINAYRTAAEEALKESRIVKLEVPVFLKIEAAFNEISQVEQLVRQTSAEVLDREYNERVAYRIRMGRSQKEGSENYLTERVNLGSSLQFKWLESLEDEAGPEPDDQSGDHTRDD